MLVGVAGLGLLLAVYAVAAWSMIIMDCDETFNYLEPLHHLIYGFGLQTWEYAPKFALRPYSFLLLWAVPLRWIRPDNKVLVYKLVRMSMATLAAHSQWTLIGAVARHFDHTAALLSLLASLCSTGMFVASSAFLPNTFSMCLVSYILAYWLDGMDNKAIMLTALMATIGWPYAAIVAAIPCLCSLRTHYPSKAGPVQMSSLGSSLKAQLLIRRLVLGTVFSLVYIVAPSLIIERYYYGRWVFPSLNTLMYNVLQANGTAGPEIFGVEPWYYYLLNLTLNFNLLLCCALLSIIALPRYSWKLALFYMNFALGLAVFSRQPHKEERFAFILYPAICVLAGIFLGVVAKIKYIGKLAVLAICVLSAMISISRNYALVRFYSAPADILQSQTGDGTICFGDSWYRYPGSFYSQAPSVAFIQAGFDGQLPMYFKSTHEAADAAMNGLNKAIPGQFTPLGDCQYFVGTQKEVEALHTPHYVIREEKIIDLLKSPAPFKWLWIPYISTQKTQWDPFVLVKLHDK